MSKTFILAEKVSAGYGVASCLGDPQFGNSESALKSKARSGVLESDKYVISWINGHGYEMPMANEINPDYAPFNPLSKKEDYALPNLKDEIYKLQKKDKKTQLRIIHKILGRKDISKIIIMTDADAEGEAIWRDILFEKKKKYTIPIERMWVTGSFKSKESISKAMNDLKPYNDPKFERLYATQKARSNGDYLVGMKMIKVISDHYNILCRVGRVKAFIVGAIGDRELEIKNFVPKDFYTLKGYKGELEFSHFYTKLEEDKKVQATQYFDELEFNKVVSAIEDAKLTGKVLENDEKRSITKTRPLPLSGNDFSKEMMSKYKITFDACEKILQYLRDEGFTTYQGTNGRYFSTDDVDDVKTSFNAVINYFTGIAGLEVKTPEFNTNVGLFNNKKAETQNHPPLHTTSKVPTQKDLDKWEKAKIPKVKEGYELIAKRILVSFLEDDEILTQKLRIEIASYLFDANGRKAIKQGWRTFMKMEVKDTTFSSSLKIGDSIQLDKIEQGIGKTKEPPLYTEKSLLDLMLNATRELDRLIKEETDPERLKVLKSQKKNLKNAEGIGTDRTRKGIIVELEKSKPQTLKATGKDRKFTLTEFGWKYYAIVPKRLKSIEFSASWENAFEMIRQGKLSYDNFINQADKMLVGMVYKVIDELGTVVKPDPVKKRVEKKPTSLDCPLCGSPILDAGKGYQCTKFVFKSTKKSDCRFSIYKDAQKILGVTYDEQKLKMLLDSTEDQPVSFGNGNQVYLDTKEKYFTKIIWENKK